MLPHLHAPLFAAAAMFGDASSSAQTLYKFNEGYLFDGAFGPIARAQTKVQAELEACGSRTKVAADGTFGPGTRNALADLAKCPRYATILSGDPSARAGELTVSYWAVLLGGDAPALNERARTLMLTYEATDYTRAEWNFCQSKPLYDPSVGRLTCYSNDPRSYLTWGPNGATGGNGREVQLILQALDRKNASLIDQSFGAEAAAIRRTYVLPDRTASRLLETYFCGVWASPARRTAWRNGFNLLGRAAETRETYDRLYESTTLDGGKIATFYAAYAAQGLTPTEVDFAFFKDRAAHTTPARPLIDAAIRTAVVGGQVPPWKIRRLIALNVRPTAQRTDRLGRDVAFYVDGAGQSSLGQEELAAWRRRGMLRASDVGLSDDRAAPHFSPGAAFSTAIDHPSTLTPAEAAACPAAVLATKRPPSR